MVMSLAIRNRCLNDRLLQQALHQIIGSFNMIIWWAIRWANRSVVLWSVDATWCESLVSSLVPCKTWKSAESNFHNQNLIIKLICKQTHPFCVCLSTCRICIADSEDAFSVRDPWHGFHVTIVQILSGSTTFSKVSVWSKNFHRYGAIAICWRREAGALKN